MSEMAQRNRWNEEEREAKDKRRKEEDVNKV
jgi:hypothetical protein